jgi:lysophospholipase L1-like esterase
MKNNKSWRETSIIFDTDSSSHFINTLIFIFTFSLISACREETPQASPPLSKPTVTNVRNILTSPNDLSSIPWTGSGGIALTSSTLSFTGTGSPAVYQASIPLSAGHQYLFVVRADSSSSVPRAPRFTYPKMRLRCYRDSVGWLTSDDNVSELGNYSVGLRPVTENHFARYTAPTDGTYGFYLQDHPENTDASVVNYTFAAVYDLTGLTGIIVDAANPQYFNLDKQIHVWGDSLTNNLVWQLRDRLGYVNASSHTYGGQTSSYILTQFLVATETWNQPTVIWSGHNTIGNTTTGGIEQVERDIKAMTDALTGDFRVLSLVYNRTWVDPARTRQADNIDAINTWLASTYGSQYVDVKTALLAGSDGSPQDRADVAKGLTPTSLRVDDIHIHAGGYDYVADAINASISTVWSQ